MLENVLILIFNFYLDIKKKRKQKANQNYSTKYKGLARKLKYQKYQFAFEFIKEET